jgi:hypothetical protein
MPKILLKRPQPVRHKGCGGMLVPQERPHVLPDRSIWFGECTVCPAKVVIWVGPPVKEVKDV